MSSLPVGRRAAAAAILTAAAAACRADEKQSGSIKVGVLHSLTGPQAFSELALVDSAVLAIEQANAAGGLQGARIEPVFADGQSNPETFAAEARRLLAEEEVAVIFGAWASADRRVVAQVVEEHDSILVFPAQARLEEHPNVFHTGSSPNQQIIPALRWLRENRGRLFYLVGSDIAYSRATNEIIKDTLGILDGEVVAETYLPTDTFDASPLVADIASSGADVIVSSLSHALVGFYGALSREGVDPSVIPTLSLTVGEDMLRTLEAGEVAGSFAAWPYFQSVEVDRNRAFIEAFQDRYGSHRRTDDYIVNAYVGVELWVAAAQSAGTTDAPQVAEALRGMRHEGPAGTVWVDETNQHLWRDVRIGQIQQDGQLEIVWTSELPIRPVTFPASRTRREWREFLGEVS